MKLRHIHQGDAVPASRPRLVGDRVYTDSKYATFKRALTIELEAARRLFKVPVADKKERYKLSVWFYRKADRADLDNLVKGCADALQKSGWVNNDSRIDWLLVTKQIDKTNPRIVIELEVI